MKPNPIDATTTDDPKERLERAKASAVAAAGKRASAEEAERREQYALRQAEDAALQAEIDPMLETVAELERETAIDVFHQDVLADIQEVGVLDARMYEAFTRAGAKLLERNRKLAELAAVKERLAQAGRQTTRSAKPIEYSEFVRSFARAFALTVEDRLNSFAALVGWARHERVVAAKHEADRMFRVS